MIILKNITIKNFFSVGNQTQAINLSNENLTLVIGENLDQGEEGMGNRNGVGKTTVINALSYALYGQAITNIKQTNLVNKTNRKQMLVTIDFEKNGVKYHIERGRSPNVLKFSINGQEYDDESQGDSRLTQNAIVDLVGMSHEMFKHIVALNTYSDPFLKMKAADQRLIIEQLLGITTLSEKAEELKILIKDTKNLISEENAKISAIQSANEKITFTINNLELKQSTWKNNQESQIKDIQSSIDNLKELDINEELHKHKEIVSWNEINNAINSLKKERLPLSTSLSRTQAEIQKIDKEIKNLESAICFTCGQSLHQDKKDEILASKTKDKTDLQTYKDELEQKIKQIDTDLSDLVLPSKPTPFYRNIDDAHQHNNNLINLESHITQIKDQSDPYIEQIQELKSHALQEIDWSNINDYTNLKEHQEFLLKLLTNKDSFVRKKIIEQNLAYLNTRLAYYLQNLGLPHQVVFQNDLSVEITQLGQDLDFDNLSRGERNRLILGLSFSFRDVWENLYDSVNLLFIDELVDSGMDSSGVENALSVLKKMANDRDKNVFLISHREELLGRVSNILKVVKQNGFTSFENDI